MKKIIVLGAGTAGLISALVLKSTFPKYKSQLLNQVLLASLV